MLNLKVNDQKPPKNKPTIETDLSEAAEKSDPPYSQEYFDLMDMIDNTDKQIDYYKMVYTAEIDGLPKRRLSLKTTTEINAAMSEISAMNFDIKDFHYNAGRTIK